MPESAAQPVTVAPTRARFTEVIACLAAIAAVKISLAVRGFAATLRGIESRHGEVRDESDDTVARIDHVVAVAAALYPGRALCLERSLVLYDRLRRAGAGARAEFRLGVQAAPFAAHAWVERHGVPVNDVLEHIEQFTPVPLGTP
ncbi:MAG: lasso peptide biosynthesis B2 protein [Gemmatimonadaceae bacterium]